MNKNITNRAFDELRVSTTSQAENLKHSINLQYAPVESLAAYLAVSDEPRSTFLEEAELTNSLVLTNKLCMLGYADLSGNAVSYEGEDMGNISDRAYFKDATFWKGERSIEYMEKTARTSDPRVLFGVPIVKNNVLVGMLFFSKEIEMFEEVLISENFNGNVYTFITDSAGTLIAAGENGATHFFSRNIFDEYTTENMCSDVTIEAIIANMKSAKSGKFCVQCYEDQQEYVSYMPLGINDWYVFGIAPRSAVITNTAQNRQNFMQAIYILCAGFSLIIIAIVFVTRKYSKQAIRERELTRQQSVRYHTILQEMKSAVFNFDVATQKLQVSDAFERIFGYTLPENWVTKIQERKIDHPEIDYDKLAKAKSDLEMTGKPTQVILSAMTKDKGMRRFLVFLTPLYDDNRSLISIYGIVTDVSDEQEEYRQVMLAQERSTLALNSLSPLIISVNLTKNSFTMLNYANFYTKAAPEEGVFDELIEIGASTIPGDDSQRFIDAFSREKQLAAYNRGERRIELEHRQLGDDGIVRWMRTWVLFVDNPYDDDIYEITLARDITESKEYEALLQKTIDLTIDNMPCYVGKWEFIDGDVLLIDANQKYLDFMDTTAEEAFGKSIIYGFSDAEKHTVMAMLYECEQERKPVSLTSRACKADGAECWIQVQASFFEEKDGHSIYYGTIMDITELVTTQNELKAAVSELEHSNAQITSMNAYRDLMNFSHEGGMMVRTVWNSEPHRILYVSPGLLNTVNYTEDEFKNSLIDGRCDLIFPQDKARVAEANSSHCELGDSFSVDYRVRHKDGHYIWVMESSMVLAMPNGDVVIVSMAINVSRQKELEQKLRVSQEEYQIAATLSNRAVLSYDISSKSFEVISQGNSTLEFSRAAKDCPEQAIKDGIVAAESVDTIRAAFAAIAQGKPCEKCVLALISHDGKKHWEEMTYSVIFDGDNRPLTAILAFDDVTAKKQAESLFNISSTFLNYSKNAAKLMVINLTTKTIAYETEGPHGMLSNLIGTNDATTAIQYTVEHLIAPEDKEACAEFFSKKRYIEAYQNGVTEESFEYRGLTANNALHWMNVQTRMVQDTYTKDIIVYIVFSDINEQKLAELELTRRAQTDSLTGLMNRESFEEEIQIKCSDPENRTCGLYNAIIMVDIDKFKQVNDTLGHDAGDDVLREVAKRISRSLRDGDLVARFGGDEFIILLPKMPSPELIEKRCLKICEALDFKVADELQVSGSIGIAICPEDGSDYDTLLKKADTAMYTAKEAGGGRCARFKEDGVQQLRVDSNYSEVRPQRKVFVRTFGYFDVFIDGNPLHFSSVKEKELLAILIDRNGGILTSEEAISLLWEDEPAEEKQLARYRKLAMNLKNTLQNAGIGDIIISNRGVRHIDVSRIECDYYQFLQGDPQFRKLYHDTYMSNYSWAEETVAALSNMIEQENS